MGESDTLVTVPETLAVPMYAAAAAGAAVPPFTSEMLEAAVAAENNALDTNGPKPAMAPNALAGLVTSGFVPVPQAPNNFMPFMGNGVQQQVMGMNQQAQAFNYAQQFNLMRYQQQLAQAQQQQQQQNNQNNMMVNNGQNNMMANNGLGNNNGGNHFVNMHQPPPPPHS